MKFNTEAAPRGVLQKKCSLKFRIIHREAPVPETYINKVTGLRPAVLLKKKLLQRFFPVNLAKFLKNTFFTEQLRTTASSNNILEGILNVRGSCSEMF